MQKTQNDNELLRFLEKYKAATLKQLDKIFFNNYKYASRRLKQLEKNKYIKSYRLNETNEKVYYIKKKMSYHDLLVYEYYAKIYELGGEVLDFQTKNFDFEKKYHVRPDAYISFVLNDLVYFNFIEVDYYHFTNISKFKRYEIMKKDKIMSERCYGKFPDLVIIKDQKDILYNSKYLNIIHLNFNLDNFIDMVISV